MSKSSAPSRSAPSWTDESPRRHKLARRGTGVPMGAICRILALIVATPFLIMLLGPEGVLPAAKYGVLAVGGCGLSLILLFLAGAFDRIDLR